jgi:hypothetical protein
MVFELAHFIRKQECKVWLHQTRDADIVFEVNNKKYAIEVETGSSIKHFHTKLLDEKIKNLNKNYRKNWFFVVTDRKIASKYSQLADTCDKRYVLSKIKRIINITKNQEKKSQENIGD